MTPTDVCWEDPPKRVVGRRRRSPWAERLDPLRDRPYCWANLGVWGATTASEINLARVGRHRPGEFEASMRGVVDGKGTLYVRYTPDGA